jgi:hypothetical protein
LGISEGEAEVYDERVEGFATRLLEVMEYIQALGVMPVMPEREEERIYQQALRQVLLTTVSLDQVVILHFELASNEQLFEELPVPQERYAIAATALVPVPEPE